MTSPLDQAALEAARLEMLKVWRHMGSIHDRLAGAPATMLAGLEAAILAYEAAKPAAPVTEAEVEAEERRFGPPKEKLPTADEIKARAAQILESAESMCVSQPSPPTGAAPSILGRIVVTRHIDGRDQHLSGIYDINNNRISDRPPVTGVPSEGGEVGKPGALDNPRPHASSSQEGAATPDSANHSRDGGIGVAWPVGNVAKPQETIRPRIASSCPASPSSSTTQPASGEPGAGVQGGWVDLQTFAASEIDRLTAEAGRLTQLEKEWIRDSQELANRVHKDTELLKHQRERAEAAEENLAKLEQEFGECNQMLNVLTQQSEMHARDASNWCARAEAAEARADAAEKAITAASRAYCILNDGANATHADTIKLASDTLRKAIFREIDDRARDALPKEGA